jgi:hypothetical protein
LFSGASTVQTECNQVHLRSTSGRLLPKGRKNCRGVARTRCLRLQRYKEKSNNQFLEQRK